MTIVQFIIPYAMHDPYNTMVQFLSFLSFLLLLTYISVLQFRFLQNNWYCSSFRYLHVLTYMWDEIL